MSLLCFPPSAGTTGQYQSTLGYRESHFLGIYMTAKLPEFCSQHIGQYCRLKTGCVGINKEEKRIITQDLGTQFHQRMNCILNLPDLTFRSSSIRRRIHDNRIVVIAAADLPLYKFLAVIHQPADRCIFQSGALRILLRPCHHSFGGIHMSNRSTCCRCCQCRTTRIGKQDSIL